MQIHSNLHTHCSLDDGKNDCEDIVLEALSKGMKSIGFSVHWPMTFENSWTMPLDQLQNYITSVRHIMRQYGNQIRVFMGAEMDYFFSNDSERDIFRRISKLLDYTIGAVHCNFDQDRINFFDGTIEERAETFEYYQSPLVFCEEYYSAVYNVIKRFKPDIFAHLDIPKKWNHIDQRFNENSKWYHDLVCSLLDSIADTTTLIEVNTGGITRGYTKDLYPSPWIIHECLKRDLSVILGSDAHSKFDLTANFEEAILELKDIGYRNIYSINHEGKFEAVKIA